MRQFVRLTESDLTRIVKRIINESQIWSDDEVSEFMNDVFRTELNRDDLDFNSLDHNKQIRIVAKYINQTADEEVANNLNKWAMNKINTSEI